MTQIKSKNHFKTALLLTVLFIAVANIFILITGKNESFQLINSHHHSIPDIFFQYFTYAGDGLMWIPLGLYCIFFKRKYVIAVIAGVLISTLLAQFLKKVIYPEELRPIAYLTENFPVHILEGVDMNRLNSFPSGHTASAFTMALIIAHMVNRRFWSIALPILALLVGYSRVYLSQHFVTDVLAGMAIGTISAVLSLMIYRKFVRFINKKAVLRSKTALMR